MNAGRLSAFVALLVLVTPLPTGAFNLFGDPYRPSQIPVPISADRNMAPQCPRTYGPFIRAGRTWNEVGCSTFAFKKRGIRDGVDAFACDDLDHLQFRALDPGVAAITAINCFDGFRETGTIYSSTLPWNCIGPAPNDTIDLETVALHEMGHMLGLGHSEDRDTIMYAYYQGQRRFLGFDDIDGICFLYPRGGFGDLFGQSLPEEPETWIPDGGQEPGGSHQASPGD